jgi:hypothetical protein
MASIPSFDLRNRGTELRPAIHHFPRWMGGFDYNFGAATAEIEKASRLDRPLTLIECSVILWIIGIVIGGLVGYVIGRNF